MNIDQRLTKIEGMLQALIEQTAPPPSIKSKAQMRDRIRREQAEFDERRKRREENKAKGAKF